MIKHDNGFILIEILISGIILASCIAAAMYLFKIGYENLGKADVIYLIHSKIPLAVNYIKASEKKEGSQDLGDGVKLQWKSEIIAKSIGKGQRDGKEIPFNIYLYRVNFIIKAKDEEKSYEAYILKYE